MADYIVSPIDTDADQLQEASYDVLTTRWNGWTPNEGNLEAWLIAAIAQMNAETRDVASDVPRSIFRYFGESIFGTRPIDATPATVGSTWVVDGAAARTIKAGTLVGIEAGDLGLLPFEVVTDVPVAATGEGNTATTGAGEVLLRSLDTGSFTSSLGSAGYNAPMIDSFVWVVSVILTGTTSGGNDGETDDEYLNRLATQLTLLSPRPVVDKDFELMAVDLARTMGYETRAVAVDGYNPNDGTEGNARCVTIVMMDQNTGGDPPTDVLSFVASQLEAYREVNFLVFVVPPVRSAVDVSWVGRVLPGKDPDTVNFAATEAVRSFLRATNWGTVTEDGEWINKTVIRQQDLSRVLLNVPGFDYWTSLSFGISGQPSVADELVLPGRVALPSVGTVVGNMS